MTLAHPPAPVPRHVLRTWLREHDALPTAWHTRQHDRLPAEPSWLMPAAQVVPHLVYDHVLALLRACPVQGAGVDPESAGGSEAQPGPVPAVADADDAHGGLVFASRLDQPHAPAVKAPIESIPHPRGMAHNLRVNTLGVVVVESLFVALHSDAIPVLGERLK